MTLITCPVRKANAGDEAELMEICRSLHVENGLFTMSEDKVSGMLRRAFTKQGAIIGIIRPDKAIEGAIYLIISDYWYSDDWHLSELFSYVPPAYRKSNHAKELINFAKRCADEIPLPLIIGVISNQRTEAKVRLYERKFDKAAGAFFVYGARSGITNGTACVGVA